MKQMRLIFILAFGFWLLTASPARADLGFTPTHRVMVIPVGDSFDEGKGGNGRFCYDLANLILMYTNTVWIQGMAGRAGADNQGFFESNLSNVGLPLAGSQHGTNTVWLWLPASGNGGYLGNSAFYTSNMTHEVQWPGQYWAYQGYLTNDYPYSTNLFVRTVFADLCYLGGWGANPDNFYVNQYSLYCSNVAILNGCQYIDSFKFTSFETNVWNSSHSTASNLYFVGNPDIVPDGSHPQRTDIHFTASLGESAAMGMDTNVWNMAFDWNSSTVASSATNHCAVTGVSRTATSFAFTFKLDRNWGPVETPDATHTNDVRNTFIHNYASQSNAVNELTTWTNVPAGTAVAYLDGVPCATNTVVNGTLSINWFHIYKGALHEQGMTVLDGTRQGRDISTVDAANYSGLTYARNIGSQSSTAWPTNGGAADYISRMAVYEAPLETLADTINAAAQQTNHTLSIVIGTPIFAPFRR